jgi:hypothetical protein
MGPSSTQSKETQRLQLAINLVVHLVYPGSTELRYASSA